MIEKTIGEIEAKIHSANSIGDEHKRELLQLLATLKTEIAALSDKQNLGHLKNSVDELRSSIGGFEQSHPQLVRLVNNISNALANWGI